MEKTCRVLVYGSLRRNERAHSYLGDNPIFIGETRLPGYDLHQVMPWFPGAVANKSNEDGILCEEYEVPTSIIPRLDDFEGFFPKFPKMSLFLREQTKDGKFFYLYNGDTRRTEGVIETGDWSTRSVR